MKDKIMYLLFLMICGLVLYSVVGNPMDVKEKEVVREKVLNWDMVDLGNYTIKPNSINKISNDHYTIDFSIQYKNGQIGFENDVKLMSGDVILNSTVESFGRQAYESNRHAQMNLRVPSNKSYLDFDSIVFLKRDTNIIKAKFNIYK